jgi:hypothetical protein
VRFEELSGFTNIRGLAGELQSVLYLATDPAGGQGETGPAEIFGEIKADIDRIYAGGLAVGSLVTEGNTGRKTEWDPAGEHKASEFNGVLPAAEAAKPMFGGL